MKPCPNLRRRGKICSELRSYASSDGRKPSAIRRKKLFRIEELCKLRRAETKRNKEAFFWFFGKFLESMCGAQLWGKQREHQLISKATLMGSSRENLVTKSDEAFALLMYENYIGK
jgi:hypothetical protein